jgi:hypothetical protein
VGIRDHDRLHPSDLHLGLLSRASFEERSDSAALGSQTYGAGLWRRDNVF